MEHPATELRELLFDRIKGDRFLAHRCHGGYSAVRQSTGMDSLERCHVQIHVECTPMERHTVLDADADESNFFRGWSHDPNAGLAGDAVAGDIPEAQQLNDDFFE